jgi:hypothetical protein
VLGPTMDLILILHVSYHRTGETEVWPHILDVQVPVLLRLLLLQPLRNCCEIQWLIHVADTTSYMIIVLLPSCRRAA